MIKLWCVSILKISKFLIEEKLVYAGAWKFPHAWWKSAWLPCAPAGMLHYLFSSSLGDVSEWWLKTTGCIFEVKITGNVWNKSTANSDKSNFERYLIKWFLKSLSISLKHEVQIVKVANLGDQKYLY